MKDPQLTRNNIILRLEKRRISSSVSCVVDQSPIWSQIHRVSNADKGR